MNAISLSDGKSYTYFGGSGAKERLKRLFGKECAKDDLLVLDKLLLRKRILRKARDVAASRKGW